MKPTQIIKIVLKIITILPVIVAGIKSIIKAYQDANDGSDLYNS